MRTIFAAAAAAFALALPMAAGCDLRRAAAPPSPHCRSGDPLAGVYHPERLRVRSRCRTATGVVERVEFEDYDGDVHIRLQPDGIDRKLLSRGNERLGGSLIVEVIPQDRSRVALPEVGSRVSVVGPWVEDEHHGWSEIHPAWWISAGRIVPATPRELSRATLLLTGAAREDGE